MVNDNSYDCKYTDGTQQVNLTLQNGRFSNQSQFNSVQGCSTSALDKTRLTNPNATHLRRLGFITLGI